MRLLFFVLHIAFGSRLLRQAGTSRLRHGLDDDGAVELGDEELRHLAQKIEHTAEALFNGIVPQRAASVHSEKDALPRGVL